LASLGAGSVRLSVMLVGQPRTVRSLLEAHVLRQIRMWRQAKHGKARPVDAVDGTPDKAFFFPRSPHPIRYRPATSDPWTILEWLLLITKDNAHLPAGPLRTIVDVGSNIGVTSCLFARMYPDARILSVEPEQSNYRLLVENSRPWERIVPVNAAVWGERCRLRFVDPHEGHWGLRVTEAVDYDCPDFGKDGGPPGITMADLFAQHQVDHVDLLKMDIEGAERAVFESQHLDEWLAKVELVAIELHPQIAGAEEAVLGAFAARSWSHKTWGNLTVFRPAESVSA
jgi:FkbM family methyltransferase